MPQCTGAGGCGNTGRAPNCGSQMVRALLWLLHLRHEEHTPCEMLTRFKRLKPCTGVLCNQVDLQMHYMMLDLPLKKCWRRQRHQYTDKHILVL